MNPRLGISHLFSKLHLKSDSRPLALAQAHPRPALACELRARVQVKISENTYSCVIPLLQQASQIALDHANQSKTIYQRQYINISFVRKRNACTLRDSVQATCMQAEREQAARTLGDRSNVRRTTREQVVCDRTQGERSYVEIQAHR